MISSDYKRGSVVRVLKGRDKGKLAAVLSYDEKFLYIADGRDRKTVRPKPKNPKHVENTGCSLKEESLLFDSRLRKALSDLSDK